MAYPNYYPATYQPYPNYYQPSYQQVQQPQNNSFNNQTSIIWVSSEQEAQSYPVAPNNAVAMWDSKSPVIYLKQADASGKPTLKAFDLVERSESVSAASSPRSSGDVEYATKSDVEALASSVREMEKKVESMGKRRVRRDEDDDE